VQTANKTSRENHRESVAAFTDPRNTGSGGRLLPADRAGSYIAARLASHNSTLIQLVALDTCLFTPNFRAAVIAHDLATRGAIFRDKVRFAYDRLPPTVKRLIALERESASEVATHRG